jgi:hypothetical protein
MQARIRRMNRRALGLLLFLPFLAIASAPPVPSSLDRFRFQPDRIVVGQVAHYVKSNLDGSKPSHVSIFVKAPDQLEVAKIEKDVTDAAWVRAHFDWKLFTADHLQAGVINLDGSVEERATFDLDRDKGEVVVTVGDRKGSAAWRQLPFHVYNFDFTSLNFAWRQLADPKAPFTIGIIDPTFQEEGDIIFYRGDAKIESLGEEAMKGKSCRKYRIAGPGIGGKTGTIWEDPKTRWLERVEIPFPDNPAWNSFRLELERVETMTPEAWKKFIADGLAQANAEPKAKG